LSFFLATRIESSSPGKTLTTTSSPALTKTVCFVWNLLCFAHC
jgi:hypothetical protein